MGKNNPGNDLFVRFVLIGLLTLLPGLKALAMAPPPPPPDATSTVGQVVTNPVTGMATTVSDLVEDPAGTPTAGTVAFVQTADGYLFLVNKVAGDYIYAPGTPPTPLHIVSIDNTAHTMVVESIDNPGQNSVPMSTRAPYVQIFGAAPPAPIQPTPVSTVGASGVRIVNPGSHGSGGRDGALVVPPTSGDDGGVAAPLNYTNPSSLIISTTNQIGIEAGSVGGNGGNGGDSYASVWSGRSGGRGGAGGIVNVTNDSSQVRATGNDMYGILAYSRSGQGGNGGGGYGAPGGGSGGTPNDGGAVTVTNNGGVFTTGARAYGIYGLSVSGNGGGGGNTYGIVGRGGDGGYSGNGGTVTITNNGTVETNNTEAHGIVAQSVGGSGGSSGGGSNLVATLQADAGAGGNGDTVIVNNSGTINTFGAWSRGILAQSVGGSGGIGSEAWGLVALGGAGGYGGNAGVVTVNNFAGADIHTQGAQSDGIFAQSVGGQGGSSFNAGGLVAVGGDGGGGGSGNTVNVNNLGNIETLGNLARGIFAQSVGGGGGDGGNSSGMVSVGGNGAGGGLGRPVNVTQSGSIRTGGNDADGIFAQSVGGGGGNGGSAGSISAFAGVAIGGGGGTGGHGGNVTVTMQGQNVSTPSVISTQGDRSTALFAQSVGGGGGNGGGATQVSIGVGVAASVAVGGKAGTGGNGGTVRLSAGSGSSSIDTHGDDSTGMFLQSVGGGGGNGGYALSFAASTGGSLSSAVGGDAGAGGSGGTVTVGNFTGTTLNAVGFNGTIQTGGDRSTGLLAQSVGGGGGNGGMAVSAALSASPVISGSLALGVGGAGGPGATGGTVAVGTQGNIFTSGDVSSGLIAQSIGGGGGNGGGTVNVAVSAALGGAGAVTLGVGGKGGTGGDAGAVTVATRNGTVQTTGDSSSGIVLQSIGGGGGNGGYSVGVGVAAGAGGAGTLNVGLGGSGGAGGIGRTVTGDLQSNVGTGGDNSAGIVAQSIGGGGGNGGYNVGAGVSLGGASAASFSVGLGGKGGAAGTGGDVTLSSTGATVSTGGDHSGGVVAQSIGGGGGNGGYNISPTMAAGGAGAAAVSVGLGGSGGGGGAGGIVTATVASQVLTTGDDSTGVLVQSVGGGGGNGGFNVSAGAAGGGIGSGAVTVGLGGAGGTAGSGNNVIATSSDLVVTTGDRSAGFVAQSIGGGGGNGGYNVNAALSGSGVGSGSIGVGLGGNGGGGGTTGTVHATKNGNISTQGNQSAGMVVQSIGGGGGNGGGTIDVALSASGVGSGAITAGIGGSGGTGGDANTVTADTTTGSIATEGDASGGIVVQSVGGGGGNGGYSIQVGVAAAGVGTGAVNVGLGGNGGIAGDGKGVNATLHSDVATQGDDSTGVLLQSVGGGGGNGGFTIVASAAGAGVGSGAVNFGMGGAGGAGGGSGNIIASSSGTISTEGDRSSGLVVQTIGGGGGNGGFTATGALSVGGVGSGAVSASLGGNGGGAGIAGTILASSSGDVQTRGDMSTGILAQSVGGGGGNGGYNINVALSGGGVGSGAVSVGLGGNGASGTDGNTVDFTVTNNVRTEGNDSAAVVTQSIGGGGGNGGFNVAVSGNIGGVGGGSATVGLGGKGAGGGSGKRVTTDMTGNIITLGDGSTGLLAQSVGGGGGNGGMNVSITANGAGTGGGGAAVGLGGSGAGGGDGGPVTATLVGDVFTGGDHAAGAVSQSIGGGGGNGGMNVSIALTGAGSGSFGAAVGLGGSGGGGGDAVRTEIDVAGDVATQGDESRGVLAQSLGGGGGNGGINVSGAVNLSGGGGASVAVGLGGSGGAGGAGGDAIATVHGDVATGGDQSTGVTAQSIGGGGGAGGINVSGALSASSSAGVGISVGLGGSGGSGGTAQAATASVTGDVNTQGDDSGGVLAQSIGGGGGSGGINVSAAVSLSGSAGGAVAVGLGGRGGSGNIAGAATATVTGDVNTAGDQSTGVTAQSIGGGGGNGGINVSAGLSASSSSGGSLAVGLGGSGGTGGEARAAHATVTGDIAAAGNDSGGLLVQSLGGGGGNGGINVSGAATLSGSSGGALSVGIGGFGGTGGTGDLADAQVTGNISTQGANANGVTVQSIGGGGGNGGINVSGSLTASQSSSGSLAVGVGGFGGGGANAGAVTGNVTGNISTVGDNSWGVFAQSLGGGGGNGGINVSGALNLSTGTSAAAAVGVGGFGGGGGNSDSIDFVRTGATTTSGAGSHGVVAQSLGGGGGNGGINISAGIAGSSSGSAYSGALGLGGFGGSGGDSANVGLTVTGDVLATGLGSDSIITEDGLMRRVRAGGSSGVIAQSLGGGGGNGGLNVSGGIALTPPSSGSSNALSLGVGGFGGGGGDGRGVTLDVTADQVAAVGDGQFGVAAQSVGGGGGNGGISISGGISMSGQLVAGVGGFGGNGGTAGNVIATASTDISVSGADAVGFLAESIGGGGGNGGVNVSGGLRPTTTTSSQPSLVFGLGGSGGAGNISGTVTATQTGTIHVDGLNSTGVLAQSIAGGGGNGGLNVSGSFSLAKRSNIAALGIGGSAGSGADAQTVTLLSDGEIIVDGRALDYASTTLTAEEIQKLGQRERGAGVLAQSIGGGGGNGGMNVTGVAAPSGNQLVGGVGGYGGGGGNAGAVVLDRGLNQASRILTAGNAVNGLVAQSIGGGGGNAGINIVFEAAVAGGGSGSGSGSGPGSNQAQFVIGGDGGAPGHGLTVDVDHAGEIHTMGDSANGLFAQSIGGGGGNANINFGKAVNRNGSGFSLKVGGSGANGGDGDAVTVDHTGTISTQGADATAIFAQSVGGGGGNAEADDSLLDKFLTGAELAADAVSDQKRSVEIEVGRSGGIGGDGRAVSVASTGTLSTQGDRSVGLRAQSIGAGGGVSSTSSVSVSSSSEVSVQVGVGGASGGRSGNVDVTTAGAIATRGTDAHAIHAQSVGGGGGEGGSVGGSLLPSGNSISVGVGGAGGTGGIAGTVDVANSATLVTQGDGAYGIHAQSIGGGGGDGGYAGVGEDDAYGAAVDLVKNAVEGGATEGGFQISSLVGGNGGTGALADAVTVGNTGTIVTAGRDAHGINAQSIGGGGGTGGMVLAGAVTLGSGNNSMGINVGGTGGDGSTSGRVSVTNEGVIHTQGDESVGLRAQSLGGGGGDAGLLAVLNIAPVPGSSQTSTNINIGGNGGTGSASDDVEVINRRAANGTGGTILTEGAASHAIFAQSLGGGGGNGSSVLDLNISTGTGSVATGFNIGGKGGDGGKSGNVEVTNEAQIETDGAGAHGVFAQSIGGGGGNGGLAIAGNIVLGSPGVSPMVAVGGDGGTGSDAGNVTVTNSGSILTRGDGSNGIVAQSIGGGGGNAGVGIPLSLDPLTIAGTLLSNLGGKGADGGIGGNVTVNHSGDITVLGNGSQAVVAESINGGGGGIALDFNGITSLPGGSGIPGAPSGTPTEPVFVLHIGGDSKQDSAAGVVTLNYTGTFGVAGDNGAASRVQAIGGGGGTFDLNLNTQDAGTATEDLVSVQGRLGGVDGVNNAGGDVTSEHDGDLLTEGTNTPGVMMQSVGGGGGRANVVVASQTGRVGPSAFTLGGERGNSEQGGDIAHVQSGSISTLGDASHGAVLQSIGGGGGVLSFVTGTVPSSAAALAPADEVRTAQVVKPQAVHPANARMTAPSTPAVSAPLSLALGSAGGSALHGGDIQLGLDGDVATDGGHAIGLLFQSIGAGGGIANVVGASALNVTLGGAGGATGNGGDLDVDNTGVIATTGAGAHGVFLQSIGGGGGAVFTTVDAPVVTLSTANAGDGGAIRFAQTGDVTTEGARAFGVFAQSLGGGGGFVDGVFAGSAGGAGKGSAIDLSLDGDVLALGTGSTALFAQSTGRDGGGDIHAALTAGHDIVGGNGGVGVAFDGGAQNLFTNDGSVMTRDGINGMAFTGGAGSDVIVNNDTVLGNLSMGAGTNRFTNSADATFYSGASLSLGAASNLLINNGVLVPGGAHLAQVSNLAGSFQQSSTGVSNLELDFATDVIDSVQATGTAQVGGLVNVGLLNVHRIPSGHFVKSLYGAAGGFTNTGLMLNPQPSVVITYNLASSPTAASLDYEVDFSPKGLRGNRIAIGDYFNRVQANGVSSPLLYDTITKFVLTTDLGAYSSMLTQLGPEFYAEQQALTLTAGQQFSRAMRDCGAQNIGRIEGDAPDCTWARFDINSTTRDSSGGSPATEELARRYAWGYQHALDSGASVGVGLAFDDSSSQGYGGRWAGEAKRFQLGLSGRRSIGAYSVGGILTLGTSQQNVRRTFNVTGPESVKGSRDLDFATWVFDVSRRFERRGGFTFTPGLAFGGGVLNGQNVAESGSDAHSLVLDQHSDGHLWIEPSVNIGFAHEVARDQQLRLYARASGLRYLDGTSTEVRAGLSGTQVGVSRMSVGANLGRTLFLVEGGVEFSVLDRLTLGMSYSLQRWNPQDSGTFAARFSIPLR